MPRKKKQYTAPVAVVDEEPAPEEGADVLDIGTAAAAEDDTRVEPEPEPVAEVPAPPAPRKTIPQSRMVVRVERLRDAMWLLALAVPKRTTLPITECVRLGDGRAVATDLDIAISLALPEAQETMLAPHRQVLEFLKYVPGHQDARLSVEGGMLKIKVGGSEASFGTQDPEDYPPVDPFEPEDRAVLNGEVLVKAMVAVLPYTATDDSRPFLNCVALQRGEEVRAVAGDGFRLAWEDVKGRLPGSGMFLIPKAAAAVLAHLWKQSPSVPAFGEDFDPVKVATAQRPVVLEWKGRLLRVRFTGERELTLTMQLVEGNFPNYAQLIPKPIEKSFQALGSDLLLALKQLSRVARDGSGIVRLQWEKDEILLAGKTEELGEVKVTVPAQTREPGRIALNLFYLMDYVGGKDGMVGLAMSGTESSPVLMTYHGRSNHVIMPMHVQWD